jgi:thiol-disulfide isomerase/thioredoxin
MACGVLCLLWTVVAGARELAPYTGAAQPPALVLKDLAGQTHDLGAYRGKVVVLNFWATWCPPCVREMPSMQKLSERLRDRPFVMLAVNMGESDDEIRAFLGRVPVSFPILPDRDGSVLKRWRVFAFPTSFVLDPEGRIRLAAFGEVDWEDPAERAKIEALFAR